MSSTKPTAKRRAIVRWGVVITALAVLATGCSQSEDGASDVSEPAASSSQTGTSLTGLSSAAPPTTESTTTTQAAVEEEPPDSGSEIATTTTSLPPAEAEVPLPDEAVVEGALSDEALGLIDVAADACADLYEFRCGRVLWDACAVLQVDLESILEEEDSVSADRKDEVNVTKEVVSYVKDRVCRFMDLAFYSELSAVLSAKYGEAYYEYDKGFYIYRDEFAIASGLYSYIELSSDEYAEIFDVLPEGYGTLTEWGRNYIPEVVRPKLGQLFLNLRSHAMSEDRLNLKPESMANSILVKQTKIETIEQCNEIYLSETWLSEEINTATYTASNNDFNRCISELCDQESGIYAIGCYPDGFISEFNYLSEKYEENINFGDNIYFLRSVLFWQILKYVCATGEIHDNSTDDCRKAAFNICQYSKAVGISTVELSAVGPITHPIGPACILGYEFRRAPYTAAVNLCFEQVETFLTTKSLLFSPTNYCNEAANECVKLYRDRRSNDCKNYNDYFTYETLWKNIPLLCAENNNFVSSFGNSNCYAVLKQSCRLAFSGVNPGIYDLYNPSFRTGETIRRALCSYLLYPYEQNKTSDSIRSNNLTYRPQTSSKIQVDRSTPETIRGEFPSVSIDPVNVAATECAKDQNTQSECIEKLWQSCFSILPTDPYINRKLIYYVCTAAWITELARMASVLSSSFPEDYQAGSFNRFMEYVTVQAVGDTFVEGILAIDENGVAHPNLNRDGLSTEVAESLTALGTSIAQLVQPYLRLPNATQQRDI